MKQQKGITLIALVITIIVLLILAGVTIAMLTGSDSAPVKANEAKQKQDIGAAKDQVYIWAQEAQTTAYENVYVNGTSAQGATLPKTSTAKSQNIGTYVGSVVGTKATSGKDVGLATITTVDNSTSTATASVGTSGSDITKTATITITTTDFTLTGYIDREAGRLVWVDNGTIKTR